MATDYAIEKLYATSLILASGIGGVKQRLIDAVESQFHRISRDRDLSGESRDEFVAILQALSSKSPTGDEGSFGATINAMSEESASELAGRIFHLYGKALHGSSL